MVLPIRVLLSVVLARRFILAAAAFETCAIIGTFLLIT